MNQFEPFCEYVVVLLNGQDGAWFKCFDNKADAERELYAEHYEFGEREPMTADEFLAEYLYTEDALTDEAPEDANEGDALATNGEILTEYEWIDELGSYLHFPEGK
ncbi:hypothetical protein [Limosilactobacillus mucosae]|uniref:hypothetical protein n=1 Tax=Limosilactobacillus mucosae TaxID=97478 RepID=UPI0022E743A6|nr:hypothetical protein [Limosilactobacillus mucosae]